jgi:hypothetical protein
MKALQFVTHLIYITLRADEVKMINSYTAWVKIWEKKFLF